MQLSKPEQISLNPEDLIQINDGSYGTYAGEYITPLNVHKIWVDRCNPKTVEQSHFSLTVDTNKIVWIPYIKARGCMLINNRILYCKRHNIPIETLSYSKAWDKIYKAFKETDVRIVRLTNQTPTFDEHGISNHYVYFQFERAEKIVHLERGVPKVKIILHNIYIL